MDDKKTHEMKFEPIEDDESTVSESLLEYMKFFYSRFGEYEMMRGEISTLRIMNSKVR